MEFGLDIVVLGAITGLSYALMASGLVLVYKSGRFINFAQGNLGVISATLLAKFVVDNGWNYWLSLVAVVGLGAVLGAAVEFTIVRRLFDAPRLVLMVATIGVAQLLLIFTLIEAFQASPLTILQQGFPVPIDAQVQVGSLILLGSDLMIIIVVPIAAAALTLFLRLTPYGQAIRASADNPDAARLSGISVRRMSTLVWMLAGLLSSISAILLAPRGFGAQFGQLGPSVLVRALAAALIARMTNLPMAFAGAVGIGVIEALAFANSTSGGVTDVVVFLVIVGALLLRARDLGRDHRRSDDGVGFGTEPKAIARRVAELPGVRLLRGGGVAAALGLALVLPLLPVFSFDSQAKAFLFAIVCGYAIVGLSLTVLTGWAGQVSLGHFALVGVGAFASARLVEAGIGWWAVPPLAGVVGALAAVAIGIPAVRIQGLFLAVTTLSFGVLATGWGFQQDWIVGEPGGVFLDRPAILRGERALYYASLLVLVLATIAVRNFRASGAGRAVIAVRDNDQAAAVTGISPAGARLAAFALSGFLAAIAGVVFAFARQRFDATSFDPATSLTLLSMVIVGGLGSVPGAILGAVFIFGLPALFPQNDIVNLAVSGVGLLIFLLYVPGGIVSAVYSARDALVDRIARRAEGRPPPPPIVPPLALMVSVARGRIPAPDPADAGARADDPPAPVAAGDDIATDDGDGGPTEDPRSRAREEPPVEVAIGTREPEGVR